MEQPEITCNISAITCVQTRLSVYQDLQKTKTRTLSEIRQSMGLSQSTLAKIVGLSQPTIHSYEKGISLPTFAKAVILSEVLKISLDELAKSMNLMSDDVIRW